MSRSGNDDGSDAGALRAIASGKTLKEQFNHIHSLVSDLPKRHFKEIFQTANGLDKSLGLAGTAGLDKVALYASVTLSACHPGTLDALSNLKVGWFAASHAVLRQLQMDLNLGEADLDTLVCLKLLYTHFRESKIGYVKTVAQGLSVVQMNKAARFVKGLAASHEYDALQKYIGANQPKCSYGPLGALISALRAHMRSGWAPKALTSHAKRKLRRTSTSDENGVSVSQAIDILAPYSRKLQGAQAARDALSKGTHAAMQLSAAVQNTSNVIADVLEIPKTDELARRHAMQIAFLLGIYLKIHKTFRTPELEASLKSAAHSAFSSSKSHVDLVAIVFPDGQRFPWARINSHATRVYLHMSNGGNIVPGLLAKLQRGLTSLFRAHKLFSFVTFAAGSVLWAAGKTMALVGLSPSTHGKMPQSMVEQFLTSSSMYLVAAIALSSFLAGVANEAKLAGALVHYDQGSFEIMLQKAFDEVRMLQVSSGAYMDMLRYNITNSNVNAAVAAAVRCAKFPRDDACR